MRWPTGTLTSTSTSEASAVPGCVHAVVPAAPEPPAKHWSDRIGRGMSGRLATDPKGPRPLDDAEDSMSRRQHSIFGVLEKPAQPRPSHEQLADELASGWPRAAASNNCRPAKPDRTRGRQNEPQDHQCCAPDAPATNRKKHVLRVLADIADDSGNCYPSIQHLMNETCLSNRAVCDAVATRAVWCFAVQPCKWPPYGLPNHPLKASLKGRSPAQKAQNQ